MTQSLKAFYKTILFHSGSEFMVCKMEIERNVRHIYLREVLLGQGNNVVLWLDENMYNPRELTSLFQEKLDGLVKIMGSEIKVIHCLYHTRHVEMLQKQRDQFNNDLM